MSYVEFLKSPDAYRSTVPWSAWHSPRDGLPSVHPFEDFNGRLTRAFLAEILPRLDLPAMDPTPEAGQDTERYRQAFKAADRADWGPWSRSGAGGSRRRVGHEPSSRLP